MTTYRQTTYKLQIKMIGKDIKRLTIGAGFGLEWPLV